MLTRRSLFGAAIPAALPFVLRAGSKSDLIVPEAGFTAARKMTVTTINGHKFAFPWELEPGDVVRVATMESISGLFAKRTRRGSKYMTNSDETIYAWSFHKRPLYDFVYSYVPDSNRATLAYHMDMSLRHGHSA